MRRFIVNYKCTPSYKCIVVYIYPRIGNMTRKKKLINFAHLNDQKGDITKCWFVEYSFRLPQSDDRFFRKRVYDGLGAGTADERYAKAEKLINTINEYLKSGEYLNHDSDYSPVYVSDGYREENKRYNKNLEEYRVDNVLRNFLAYKKSACKISTVYAYSWLLRRFAKYVNTYLKGKYVTQITNDDIVAFLQYIENERQICRYSVKNISVRLHTFFEYMELYYIRPRHTNPVYDIPVLGRIVDKSPEPYTREEREMLRAAIFPNNPYLWLSCEMIYYCAIRPGIELRNLKIKDIDQANLTITIHAEFAKNNRKETIKMPQVLLDLMNMLHLFEYDKEYYVFGREWLPSPLRTAKRLNEYFKPYRDALGISTTKTYYSFKHTGAISAASNGANPFDLQAHLRHKSIATTEQYIKKRIPANNVAEKYIDKI